MNRPVYRFLVAGFILTTLFSVPLSRPQTASAQVAPVVISGPSGHVGPYSLDSNPVKCKYFSSGSLYEISTGGLVRVKAYASHPLATQKVIVTTRLYQRLATGSYKFQAEIPAGTVTPNKLTFSSVSVGAITNVVTGPDWILAHRIRWYKSDNVTEDGSVIIAYPSYQRIKNNSNDGLPTSVCGSPYLLPNVWLEHQPTNTYTGTVNSHVEFELHKFAIGVTVNIKFNGTNVGSVVTNNDAEGIGDFVIPAVQKGTYPIEFKYGHWIATGTVTVKPRIKIIPSQDIARDQLVNVSLRGFKAGETVRIRWKKGDSWVEIARVTTSSTGSKNINVHVPTFVPNGSTKVRGDGNKGASAQTNAVTVFGGPFSTSSLSSPTATPTATSTAKSSPATTATATPTLTPSPSPMLTATTTVAPTETPAPSATAPVETPPQEPTTLPEASPVA